MKAENATRDIATRDIATRDIAKVTLVGTVGRDPDIYQTKDGRLAASFSMSTKRPDEPGRHDWHRIVALDRYAHFAEDYVNIGDRIYVEGVIRYDSYERDNIVIPTTEIHVREIVTLSRRPTTSTETAP